MYKNFILTEAEKAKILEDHMKYGYKQPLSEQGYKQSTKPLEQPDDLIGKTVTFYFSKDDADEAAKSGHSKAGVPSNIFTIKHIDSVDSTGVRFVAELLVQTDEGEKSYMTDRASTGGFNRLNNMVFDKTDGTFNYNAKHRNPMYNTSLKNALMYKYFQTDFAANDKPVSTISENEDWTKAREALFGSDVDSAAHIQDLNDIQNEFREHLKQDPNMSFDDFIEYFDKIDVLVDDYGKQMEQDGMDMHDEENLEKFYEIRAAGEDYKEKISQEYEHGQQPLNEGKIELIKTFNKFFK